MNQQEWFLLKKKATVREVQQLAGLLNFFNKAIIPGRTFTHRMYACYSHITDKFGNKKHSCTLLPHHHVSLNAEFRNDCRIWKIFLEQEGAVEGIHRPFKDLWKVIPVTTIGFYSDASGSKNLRIGTYYDFQWSFAQYEPGYIETYRPSIEYLELLALCTGIFIWGKKLAYKRIRAHCDNRSVVDMINNELVSKCKNCMHLMRMLSLAALRHGFRIFAIHVKGIDNILSDSLSRLDFKRFFENAPSGVSQLPKPLPQELWPASKLWLK